MAKISFATLSASRRSAPAGTKVKPVAPNKRLEVSIMLPTRASDAQLDALIAQVESGARKPLSVRELQDTMGASDSHRRKLQRAAKAQGLTVLRQTAGDKAHGIMRVKGTYARFQKFFPSLTLHVFEQEDGQTMIGREGTIQIPASLPILGVFGFDERSVAHTNYRFADKSAKIQQFFTGKVDMRLPGGLTSRGLAKLQGIPVDALANATPFATGYISLGGDNGKKLQADCATVAKKEGVTAAKFVGVSVDGTAIDGDYNDGATVENALDAQAHVLMNPNGYCIAFRADNSDDAFARAQEAANVYVLKVGGVEIPFLGVSISWGMAESEWTEQSLKRWERAFKAARLRGLIVTSATGDNGSKDNTKADTPDAPSCVPHNIGAAGVYIRTADGKTVSEVGVWNDGSWGGATGGGISAVFGVMDEEKALALPVSKTTGKPGHNASLVADCAAPDSGPQVLYKGRYQQVGGTSHSAPFINIKLAHLRMMAKDGRMADPVGFIYANAKGMFQQVTVAGNNGDYDAKPGDVINVPVGFGVINWNAFAARVQGIAEGTSDTDKHAA